MLTQSEKLEELYNLSQRDGGIILEKVAGVFYPFAPRKLSYKHFIFNLHEIEALGCLCKLGEKPFPEHLVCMKFRASSEFNKDRLGEYLGLHHLNHQQQDEALLTKEEFKEHLEMEFRLIEAGLIKGIGKNLGGEDLRVWDLQEQRLRDFMGPVWNRLKIADIKVGFCF